jgi:hypothetical protein
MAGELDVHIGEVNTNVRATDSQALLNSQVLDTIARTVVERVLERLNHDSRVRAESALRPSVDANEGPGWE